LTAGRLPTTAE